MGTYILALNRWVQFYNNVRSVLYWYLLTITLAICDRVLTEAIGQRARRPGVRSGRFPTNRFTVGTIKTHSKIASVLSH